VIRLATWEAARSIACDYNVPIQSS